MSSSKRWNFKNLFVAGRGCGCKPKAADAVEPTIKSKTNTVSDQNPSHCLSSSASGQTNTSTLDTDSSPQICPDNKCCKTISPCLKIHDSLAVDKDSDDPYRDFRQSMLQMIFEKEIYSRSDLQQLLQCFLELNSPHHHQVIVQAFMEIWNGAVVVPDGGKEEKPPCSSDNY